MSEQGTLNLPIPSAFFSFGFLLKIDFHRQMLIQASYIGWTYLLPHLREGKILSF
jgi:hypothetical protein